MTPNVIRTDGLGKQYRIGTRERYRTLRDTLTDSLSRPMRVARRWLNGLPGDATRSETFWALRDVSFDVAAGTILGVIGRNGAGKSTLLKLLSRITEPTVGRIEIRGRVGSLLEVGTGFHPELTGRENVFLNGAILGMKRSEIARNFDDIVSFAEVEQFVDTPVKHYSSGMYMRLAFAVAAHLQPEILLVDEVLAVGDAQFQKKCLGKMGEVAKSGRTVLFVSHNMAAISTLCTDVLLLDHGRVATRGRETAIAAYSGFGATESQWQRSARHSSDRKLAFNTMECELQGEQPYMTLVIRGELTSLNQHPPAFLAFDVVDSMSVGIFQALPQEEPYVPYSATPIAFETRIELPPLIPGTYRIHAWVGPHYTQGLDLVESAVAFTITSSPTAGRSFPHTTDHGYVVPRSTVSIDGRPVSREPIACSVA
jgi:lipopolysaccharide transport system ATP-binding protein